MKQEAGEAASPFLFLGRSPLLMQLKYEHFDEGLRAEHTLFDLRHFRAPVVRGDGDYSLAHVKPTRYGFPVGVLEADFFIHADCDAFVLLFPFVVAFNEMILANTGPQSTQW